MINSATALVDLLKEVVRQIEKDASFGDYTAIDELLKDIPIEKLKLFLSEGKCK